MRLRKGKRRYPLNVDIGQIIHAHLDTSSGKDRNPLYSMVLLRPENLPEGKRGTPTHYAIDRSYPGLHLLVYPTPDAACELVIRYYPSAREI